MATRTRRTADERIRFGGRPDPRGWLFELSGGHPALDLANTKDERRTAAPRELLADYATLVGWAEQAGLAVPRVAARLRAEAERRPAAAAAGLRRVQAIREHLFELFSAVVDDRPLPPASLAAFNAALARALANARIVPAGVRGAPSWSFADAGALDLVVAPALKAAADLLVSERRSLVRRCEGAGCAWLFLDESRNHTRRWCDMTVCGNREKAARHRARRREEGPS